MFERSLARCALEVSHSSTTSAGDAGSADGSAAIAESYGPSVRVLSQPPEGIGPALNRAFAASGRHGLPVNFLCWGRLDDGTEVVRRNPDAVIVIDHLGLLQPSQLEYGITPRNGGLT